MYNITLVKWQEAKAVDIVEKDGILYELVQVPGEPEKFDKILEELGYKKVLTCSEGYRVVEANYPLRGLPLKDIEKLSGAF